MSAARNYRCRLLYLSIVKIFNSFNINLPSEKGNDYFYNIISCDLQRVWPSYVVFSLTSKPINKAGTESGN